MANLYGVANPLPLPQFAGTSGGIDVSCPANTETNVITVASNVPISQGIYYPCVSLCIVVLLGATAPTQLSFGTRIGAGSDFGLIHLAPALLVANATEVMSTLLFGPSALVQYATGPLNLSISINPAGQAVTCKGDGTLGWFWWQRAPDQ